MASFNQKIDPTNDPTYLGLAKETDKPLSMPADTKGAAFLEGTTKIGNAGINTVDSIFKEGIKDKLREGIDQIQGQEFGVDQATANAASGQAPSAIKGDSSSPLNIMNPEGVPGAGGGGGKTAKGAPAGVTKLGETMSDLTDSYNAGKLSQSYYYGKMNALVKQVSQQFPGYKEDVISAATSMLGTNPANALRKALLDDLDANARAQAAKKNADDSFFRYYALVLGPAGASMYEGWKAGKVGTETAVSNIIRGQGVKSNIELARAQLSLINENDAAAKKSGEEKFSTALGTKVDLAMSSSVDATGKTLQEIQTAITTKPNMSGAERMQLVQAHTAIRVNLEADLMKDATAIDPRSGKSFYGVHGPEKTKQVIDASLARVDLLSDALTNDKRGIANWAAAGIKSNSDERAYAILKDPKFEVMANVKTMETLGAKDYINSVLVANPSAFPALTQALSGVFAYKMASGEAGSLSSTVSTIQAHPRLTDVEKQQLTFASIQNSAKLITDPLAKPENIATTGRQLFSDANLGFLTKFSPKDQSVVYAKLASPEIAQKIKSTGDPVLWNQFQKWSVNSFEGMYRDAVQELQTRVVEKDWYTVSYNEKNHQYVVSPRPDKAEQIRHMNQAHGRPGDSVLPSVAAPLNRINAALRTVTPILAADNQDPKSVIVDSLTRMGYAPAKAPASKDAVDLKKILNQ